MTDHLNHAPSGLTEAPETKTDFDVIIIGGSYAGMSAAMALGRSLRNVLIIDSGQPCNSSTPASHNFLTHDGAKPLDITLTARAEVLRYPTVRFLNDFAERGEKISGGFEVVSRMNGIFTSKKIILATGIKDQTPGISGFAECWGISVIHCPYCHGYEFRGKPTALMANGERAFHLATLIHNLTSELTIFTSGPADFKPEQRARLSEHKIPVIETRINVIQHNNGVVNGVILEDGSHLPFSAIYASLPFKQHSEIPAQLGCAMTEQGYIQTDAFQKTIVEGVFACGDNSSMVRSLASSVATGNLTGAMVNSVLAGENF